MAYLPPNVFDSGIGAPLPDDAAASVALSRSVPADAAADLSCIGEIFIGAAKLEPPEIWFENSAYPREDELLYEVLSAMDDPRLPGLAELPYGMEWALDPPPLFLQMAV